MPPSNMIAPSKIESKTFPRLSRETFGILLISLAARWILVFRGGQDYFSDEVRYEFSRIVAKLLLQGDVSAAFTQIFKNPEHLGFQIIGIVPALVEYFTRDSLVIPGLFFSIFSVLNLYLIYAISLRAGANQKQALHALIFSAMSMSLLYYTRHLLPYDTGMTFGLLAVHAALDERPSARAALACGVLSFLCFITYNGYWILTGLTMVLCVLRRSDTFAGFFRTGIWTAIGFIAPALLLLEISALAGINLVEKYRSLSTTVSQGTLAEGWSLPFEYYWHTEHFVFIAFLVLAIPALFDQNKRNKTAWTWAGAAAFIYLNMVLLSVVLQKFVVMARQVRQMTPFLILLAAGGLAVLEQRSSIGQKLVRGILAVLLLQAGWNYLSSYNLTYPREFVWKTQTRYPEFEFSEKRLAFGAPTLCQNNGYILEYVKHFELPPKADPEIQGQILLSAPHPDNFLPYQYEGYTYDQRLVFHELKPEMRLYKPEADFMSDTNPIWTAMKNCWIGDK
jgi:hypothetical protein